MQARDRAVSFRAACSVLIKLEVILCRCRQIFGRILFILQKYGVSFLNGAGKTMALALVGTTDRLYHRIRGRNRPDNTGG